MRLAIGHDDLTDTVSLEFECKDSAEAEELMGRLMQMVERGHVDFHLADASGEPPSLSTMQ